MLRGSHRPDSLVLLTLFPPRAAPGQRRSGSRFYNATTEQILAGDGALSFAINADLIINPGYSLGLVVNEPLPVPDDWGSRPEHFAPPRTSNGSLLNVEQQQAERERRCMAWVANDHNAIPPRQWGASSEHIAPCLWLFAECDQEGLESDAQLELAAAVFGAEPTFSIHTGGKSVHVYFRLLKPIAPARFTELQTLVIRAYAHISPGCAVDPSLKKPNQVLRLAGGVHPRTGCLATIHTASNTLIDPGALENRLSVLLPPPAPSPRPPAARRPVGVTQRGIPPTLDQIRTALDRIPPYASGEGQRPEFIRFVGGLRAAVIEAGGADNDALDLATSHSAGVLDVDDYWRTDWTQISAGSLWFQDGGRPKPDPDWDGIAAANRAAARGYQ
jgi:hypothetical protein